MNNLELIANQIHIIRNQKVMLDYDLAVLYGNKTKVLKQAVRRNISRFPEDFMFELTKEEFDNLKSQFVTSSYGGMRYLPFAFTEQGVAMLSGVINSEKAIAINIAIMRTFVLLRKSMLNLEEITKKVKEIENQFPDIYKILNYLMDKDQQTVEQKNRPKIGYKS
jgi:hypothetical protein